MQSWQALGPHHAPSLACCYAREVRSGARRENASAPPPSWALTPATFASGLTGLAIPRPSPIAPELRALREGPARSRFARRLHGAFLHVVLDAQTVAKSRFWYFVSQFKKLKRANGEILSCKIHEKNAATVKNFGIWIRYDSRSLTHNL